MNNNTNLATRLCYIDIAKGLGMLTILWGHIIEKGITNSFVYAFHIPLFFVLSGMVFNRERYINYKTFLLRKIQTLLVPYFMFSFLTWIIWCGYIYMSTSSFKGCFPSLMQTFIAQGSGGYLVHNVPLWFVTCLFVIENVYFFISKLNSKIIIFISLACAVVGYFFNTQPYSKILGVDTTQLPWNIEVAMSALIFFCVGNLTIKKYSHNKIIETIKLHKLACVVISMICFVVVYYGAKFNGHVTMGSNILGNPFVFYICAILGVISIIIISIILSILKTQNSILRFIKWFGQNSYYAMVIHNPIKGIVAVFVGAIVVKMNIDIINDNIYILGLITFIITMIITSFGIEVINKIKQYKKK